MVDKYAEKCLLGKYSEPSKEGKSIFLKFNQKSVSEKKLLSPCAILGTYTRTNGAYRFCHWSAIKKNLSLILPSLCPKIHFIFNLILFL